MTPNDLSTKPGQPQFDVLILYETIGLTPEIGTPEKARSIAAQLVSAIKTG